MEYDKYYHGNRNLSQAAKPKRNQDKDLVEKEIWVHKDY